MAAPASLPALLDSLTQSLTSASEAAPKLSGLAPPKDGLSLLDVKNDLLLSYLQNLVFLILLKLRNSRDSASDNEDTASDLNDTVVKKLVELRLYIEKGVRPLEDKLRYQIEKALRAADDAERTAQAAQASQKEEEESDEDESGSGSEDDSEAEEDGERLADLKKSLPNRAAFVKPSTGVSEETSENTDGIYRPPKIAPTAMPTTERRERAERRPLKSATMDEFIADELSTAPSAEPSIGTNIGGFGRHMKTASQRKEEDERRDYEERNFVRLPKASKEERAKKAKAEGRSKRMNFGGEEWRELGEGVDRIHRLTKTKGSGGGTRALLDKSRKRGIETVDGPRGSGISGAEIGDRYNKRLKVQEMGRRDRGKKR